MPGFLISNKKLDVELNNVFNDKCIKDEMTCDVWYVKRNTLNKFMQDKEFLLDEDILVVVEGCILNKIDLLHQYEADTMFDLCKKMYSMQGETFFRDFRGSFSGAVYDRKKDLLIAYTNHVGDRPLFYMDGENECFIGSQVNYVIDACRELGIHLSLDENAAYHMLTFAFMEDNSTYAKEIKRLLAGEYLRIEKGKAAVQRYHRFKKNAERFRNSTEDEILAEIDCHFRKAVEMEYNKDEEYGFEHRADMSGGLDSRMAIWVAHSLKDRHIQLNTVCKSNDLEELIAKQIAYYWKDEICVRADDSLAFLYDVDLMVRMLGGLSLYMGPTSEYRMLLGENTERFGLKHTGQVGDAILGSFRSGGEEKQWPTGRYSEKLAERVQEYADQTIQQYDDKELYLLYVRGFLGAINTHQFIQNFTEVSSPFLDVAFFQLCLDIPVELRAGHYIYKEWILKYYPDAAKYKWERIDDIITNDKKEINRWKTRRDMKRKIRKILAKDEERSNLDILFDSDQKAQTFVKKYVKQTYPYFRKMASGQFCNDMKELYLHGGILEKSMVLTVLSSAKLYFQED
ncbi:MAG: hypothetical protein K2K90_01075 [Lachnospiraceae bacterium]|nr:hypothetical protein [Lachnospiraceae bacterium]